MENPPPLPVRPPLGRTFFVLLLVPILCMGLAAGMSLLGGPGVEDAGVILSWIALLAMLICSICCAIITGKRWSGGLGILMFFGIQILYIAVAFAGCATVLSDASFH